MNSMDIFYDLLLCKTESQIFYNDIMVRMVNPMARDLFKTFRDENEKEVVKIRKIFLSLDARPNVFKSFIRRKA